MKTTTFSYVKCLYRHAFNWDCLQYNHYLPPTLSVTSSNTSRLHPSNPPQSSPTRAGCPLASFSSPGFPPFLINNHEPIPRPSTSSTLNHLANTLYHSHTPSEVPQRQELHRTDAGGLSPQPGYSRPPGTPVSKLASPRSRTICEWLYCIRLAGGAAQNP